MNWELIGEAAQKLKGDEAKVLKEAHAEVEEEDEHLYHTMGWARALARVARSARRPPAPEQKHTKSAIGADRAKQARKEMLSRVGEVARFLDRAPARRVAFACGWDRIGLASAATAATTWLDSSLVGPLGRV